MVKIADLGPRSKSVNIVFKVIETGDVREVRSRDGGNHTVADVTVGDETGTAVMALWDENISKVEDGSNYMIKNGYTTLFRGSIRLNVGRYGEISPTEEEIGEIKEDNNISERVYPDERRRPYATFGSDYRGYSGSSRREGSDRSRGRWKNRF
jgi:replication factor A1